MLATRIEDGSIRRIIIRPNRSMTWEQTKTVYFCIASYSLAIAGAFAVMGFWPVLPFAGAEIAVLGVAFYVNALAGTSVQVVTVGDDVVTVEKERPGPRCEWRFHRAWARVDVDWSSGARSSRLVVRSHGNEVVLGEFLTEAERALLAATLVDVLRDGNPSGSPDVVSRLDHHQRRHAQSARPVERSLHRGFVDERFEAATGAKRDGFVEPQVDTTCRVGPRAASPGIREAERREDA